MERVSSTPLLQAMDRARVLGNHESVNVTAALKMVDRRQRTFAALAQDTACLEQMVAVLAQRSAAAVREATVGLVEETQLYAICLEELSIQISVHSPPLSRIASSLYKGFTQLFRRALEHEKARLNKEREAHELTREKLAQSVEDARRWKETATRNENKLSVLRQAFDEKDRALTHAQTLHNQARTQANRMRKVLEGHVGADRRALGREDDPALKLLTDSVARVDATAAEAESTSEEVGQAMENLNLMVRALSMREEKLPLVDTGVQTDSFEVAEEDAPRKVKRRKSVIVPKKVARSAMSRISKHAFEGTLEKRLGASLLPAPIVMKIALQLLSSDLVSIGAIYSKTGDKGGAQSDVAPPLAEHVYDLYLQMYGVKKLAEQHISSLVFSIVTLAEAGHVRLETFARMCCLVSAQFQDFESHLANLLYTEFVPIATYEDERTDPPTAKGGSGRIGSAGKERINERLTARGLMFGDKCGGGGGTDQVFVTTYSAATRIARSLFEHTQSLHRESFDKMITALDKIKFDLAGRAVVDVDVAVATLVREYQQVHPALRQECMSLFSAGDVNDDGILSLQEFKEVVKLVMPSILNDERKVWQAFRECCSAVQEGDDQDEDDTTRHKDAKVGVVKASSGVSAETFVAVMERMGLLGVQHARAATADSPFRDRSGSPPMGDDDGLGSASASRRGMGGPPGLMSSNSSRRLPAMGGDGCTGTPPSQAAPRMSGRRGSTAVCSGGEGMLGRRQSVSAVGGKLAALALPRSESPKATLQNALYMSMLKHTWVQAGEAARRDISQMRASLSGCLEQLRDLTVKARGPAQESYVADLGRDRVMLDGELKTLVVQVDHLDTMLKGDDDSIQADAWSAYRETVLKLERLVARVKDLAEKVKDEHGKLLREARFGSVAAATSRNNRGISIKPADGRAHSKLGNLMQKELRRVSTTVGIGASPELSTRSSIAGDPKLSSESAGPSPEASGGAGSSVGGD